MDKLLSREEFKAQVFERDDSTCVICEEVGVDAHHIIERSLFEDGGYYLDNGVTLCSDCHIKAETTEISCKELRERAGITSTILPEHLDEGDYDKWGNPILPNGMRLRGELFFDENVQKVLKQGRMLHLFTDKVKYPRTFHFPWSPGLSDDDKVLKSKSALEGEEVVATVKMDGENFTLYSDYSHARSINSAHHPSRAWIKRLHAQVAHEIPKGWRVCGENMYAVHSIPYENLEDYFLVFSIWDEKNNALSWDETVEWAKLLGLSTVPVLYRGEWDEEVIRGLFDEEHGGDPMEGYVVRVARKFAYKEFPRVVGKFVRENHVQTDEHWMSAEVVANKLKDQRSRKI